MSGPENNDNETINIKKVCTVIAGIAGIAGLFGAWFVLPYRMSAAEAKIDRLETEVRVAREILIRIDENVKELRKTPR